MVRPPELPYPYFNVLTIFLWDSSKISLDMKGKSHMHPPYIFGQAHCMELNLKLNETNTIRNTIDKFPRDGDYTYHLVYLHSGLVPQLGGDLPMYTSGNPKQC